MLKYRVFQKGQKRLYATAEDSRVSDSNNWEIQTRPTVNLVGT